MLADPPFNDSDWPGELLKYDKLWVCVVDTGARLSKKEKPIC